MSIKKQLLGARDQRVRRRSRCGAGKPDRRVSAWRCENDPAIREAEATYLANAEVKPQARAALLPGLTLGSTRQQRFQDTRGGALSPEGIPIGTRSIFDQDGDGWSIELEANDLRLEPNTRRCVRRTSASREPRRTIEAAKQQSAVARRHELLRRACSRGQLASAVAARESVSRQLEQSQRRFEVGLDRDHRRAAVASRLRRRGRGRDRGTTLRRNAHEVLREIVGEIVPDLAARRRVAAAVAGPGERRANGCKRRCSKTSL